MAMYDVKLSNGKHLVYKKPKTMSLIELISMIERDTGLEVAEINFKENKQKG